MPIEDEVWMRRCIELASRGAGFTAPNPMVGCVIVCEGQVVSEGWHRALGENHAERDAILRAANDPRLQRSTLYVNLEPCAHHGRTPPCADLIAEYKIPEVVFGCHDPFEAVSGRGIEKLSMCGIKVRGPLLESECKFLNRRFLTFHRKNRPYIILKWAETADGFMAPVNRERKQISGDDARVLLHRWRSEESAILVGVNTIIYDKPELTVRFGSGKNPLPVVIDPGLRSNPQYLPKALVFNKIKSGKEDQVEYILAEPDKMIESVMSELYRRNIISVLVEGGKETLERWLYAGIWDEIRVIRSKKVTFENGIKSPDLTLQIARMQELKDDVITTYYNT